MNYAIILLYEGYTFVDADITVSLLVRQTKLLGKFIYQSDDVFDYVTGVVCHNIIPAILTKILHFLEV